MAAPEPEAQSRRRRRLFKGLLLGGAALGVPALLNSLIARRARALPAADWGREHRYAWRHGDVVFRRLGRGEPLVLLHSLGPGHDAEQWRAAAVSLAENHDVFAVDLLGWGRSEKPRLAYDGELYLQLVANFLEDVVGERALLAAAGSSAGYAVQAACDHPERVRALALVGPLGLSRDDDEPNLRDALVHRLLRLPIAGRSLLNALTSQAALAAYLRREQFAAPEQADAARVEHHYRSSHQPGSHLALAALLCGYLNLRVEEAVGRLGCPLWLAWGREAKSPRVETADVWLQLAPHARLEVFEGCGNLPHLEAPGRFAQRLEGFLSQLAA